ncbi:hypothetical protein FJZ31_32785 [Candidatus Poribacteria bacterium]|nr:hypothetical protein [Candidatus Poribacteria bacterium]
MLSQRVNPVSLDDVQEVRGKLYELLAVVILLGLLVGVIGSVICSLTENWIKSPVGISVIVGLILIIFYFLYRVLYGGTDIEKPIELVLMYCLTQGRFRIELRKSYNITEKARNAFDMAFSDEERRQLVRDWENAQVKKEPFEEFIADYYRQLIHYLFLIELKKYGAGTLSGDAYYDWSRDLAASIPAEKLTFNELASSSKAKPLKENIFLAKDKNTPDRLFYLPKGMRIYTQKLKKGREEEIEPKGFIVQLNRRRWRLLPKFAAFSLIIYPKFACRQSTKNMRVLAKRSDETNPERIWMIEAKIMVSVSFNWLYSFGRKFEYYYHWIVGLVNHLEAEFDINRYREYQLLRLVELMDDKIGQIKSDELERIPREESLVGQLQAINEKLELVLNRLPDKS